MLLIIEISKLGKIEEDEIIIILSIESVKRIEFKGNREKTIKNIIKDSIELDFKWCCFKYKENEIDIEQKLGNISNNKDNNKILIDLNYTIPVIITFVEEQKIKSEIQCLLGNRIDYKIKPYFDKINFDSDYYYLIYNNEKIYYSYSKKFYEIIILDKNINNLSNINIYNNNKKLLTLTDNLEKENTTIINHKDKIMIFQLNDINEKNIKI